MEKHQVSSERLNQLRRDGSPRLKQEHGRHNTWIRPTLTSFARGAADQHGRQSCQPSRRVERNPRAEMLP